tara:strand:+ start:2693 stop:3094 length:402 start_codon:yes stop_codon:yes gene_type:complete
MRFNEFSKLNEDSQSLDALISVLNFLRQRANDKRVVGKISFDALSKIMNNLDQHIDYGTFSNIFDTHPALKNLVKDFNEKDIVLLPFGDEPEEEMPDTLGPQQPDDEEELPDQTPAVDNTVNTMAKRALGKRI